MDESGMFLGWWIAKIGNRWHTWVGPLGLSTFRTKREAVAYCRSLTREFGKQARETCIPEEALQSGIEEVLSKLSYEEMLESWPPPAKLMVSLKQILLEIAEQLGYRDVK